MDMKIHNSNLKNINGDNKGNGDIKSKFNLFLQPSVVFFLVTLSIRIYPLPRNCVSGVYNITSSCTLIKTLVETHGCYL